MVKNAISTWAGNRSLIVCSKYRGNAAPLSLEFEFTNFICSCKKQGQSHLHMLVNTHCALIRPGKNGKNYFYKGWISIILQKDQDNLRSSFWWKKEKAAHFRKLNSIFPYIKLYFYSCKWKCSKIFYEKLLEEDLDIFFFKMMIIQK